MNHDTNQNLEFQIEGQGCFAFQTWGEVLQYRSSLYSNEVPMVKWIPEAIIGVLITRGHDFSKDIKILDGNGDEIQYFVVYNPHCLLDAINALMPTNCYSCETQEVIPLLKSLKFLRKLYALGEDYFTVSKNEHFYLIGLLERYEQENSA